MDSYRLATDLRYPGILCGHVTQGFRYEQSSLTSGFHNKSRVLPLFKAFCHQYGDFFDPDLLLFIRTIGLEDDWFLCGVLTTESLGYNKGTIGFLQKLSDFNLLSSNGEEKKLIAYEWTA